MEKALEGARVLITRPEAQGKLLANELAEHGATPFVIPALAIAPTVPLAQDIEAASQADIVIFLSPNAVMHCPDFSPHRYSIFLAIGKSTAQAVRERGWPLLAYPEHATSEDLLLLPELDSVANKKLVLVCGRGGRELLQQTLAEREAKITRLEVYQREEPDNSAQLQAVLSQEEIDVVIATSQQALAHTVKMAGKVKYKLLAKQVLVVSERLVHVVQDLGFLQQPWCAKGADNSTLVESLLQWWPHH